MAEEQQVNELVTAGNVMDRMVADALAARGKAPTEYTCENGMVLGLRKVSRSLISEAISKHNKNRPKPPVVVDKETGREFPNDLDPTFLDEQQDFNNLIGKVTTSIYLGLGTYVKTPSELKGLGLYAPGDAEWVTQITEFAPDIDIPAVGSGARYVAWLTMYALTNDDQTILSGYLMGYFGQTREEAVAEAAASFSGDVRRGTDNGSSPSAVEANTDTAGN